MLDSIQQAVARPLVGMWLTTSRHSWRRSLVADDSPHVHAPGTNPDRVLITGDGAATGRGVVTHDLGLPGHFARSLTAHTGRATDVDIVVAGNMTARSCLPALDTVALDRFDVIVLSLGANEALAFTSTKEWTRHLETLLAALEERASASAKIFVLPIPFFGINPHLPPRLAEVVDRHVQRMNAVTQEALSGRARVTMIPVAANNAFEIEGSHLYQRWAAGIALRISEHLDPDRPKPANTSETDEQARQLALADFDTVHTYADTVLDRLTTRARQAFGASMAAVTLIQSDTQFMKSASGMEPVLLPRKEAFCDITIRRSAHFVIEDASLDSRYSDYSVVTGEHAVRFYAGYPIESRDGQRVGALCIMDQSPRRFTDEDAVLLRSLAQEVQSHLWRISQEHERVTGSSRLTHQRGRHDRPGD